MVSAPTASSRSIAWSSRARPCTWTSDFGILSVIGRMRVPSPAASTMPVFGIVMAGGSSCSVLARNAAQLRRDVSREPVGHRGQGRMADILLDEPPDPRNVLQVVGLAVAHKQPGEDADDLAVALRAEHRIGGDEFVAAQF